MKSLVIGYPAARGARVRHQSTMRGHRSPTPGVFTRSSSCFSRRMPGCGLEPALSSDSSPT